MSSPADSILNRIANAVASPFYTRTRNARTAATDEANPGANPDLVEPQLLSMTYSQLK